LIVKERNSKLGSPMMAAMIGVIARRA